MVIDFVLFGLLVFVLIRTAPREASCDHTIAIYFITHWSTVGIIQDSIVISFWSSSHVRDTESYVNKVNSFPSQTFSCLFLLYCSEKYEEIVQFVITIGCLKCWHYLTHMRYKKYLQKFVSSGRYRWEGLTRRWNRPSRYRLRCDLEVRSGDWILWRRKWLSGPHKNKECQMLKKCLIHPRRDN